MKKNEESGERVEAPKPPRAKTCLVKCPNCWRWYGPAEGTAVKGGAGAGEAQICPYCGMRNEDVPIA